MASRIFLFMWHRGATHGLVDLPCLLSIFGVEFVAVCKVRIDFGISTLGGGVFVD